MPAAARRTRVEYRADTDPQRGFRSPRDFLAAVVGNGENADPHDERLRALRTNTPGEVAFMLPRAYTPPSFLAAAGSDEQGKYDNRYGGFATGAAGLTALNGGARASSTDVTAGRTQPVPMETPDVIVLARNDADHASSVSGGIRMARKAETVAGGMSRMELERIVLSASTILGLTSATEEVLVDSASSFYTLLERGYRDEAGAQALTEKLYGLGGNQYIGVVDASCSITVPRDTSSRILGADVINMRARCWGYQDAIWIANYNTYPELVGLGAEVHDAAATPISGAANASLYQHARAGEEADTLAGRPIFYTDLTQTLGTKGDLVLGNWSQYLEGVYTPLQSVESVHVRFVEHERVIKFSVRNAGAPWWRVPLTPKYGSATLSPFVLLS